MAGHPVIHDLRDPPGDLWPVGNNTKTAILLAGCSRLCAAVGLFWTAAVYTGVDAGATGRLPAIPVFCLAAGGDYDSVDGYSIAEQAEAITTRRNYDHFPANLSFRVSFLSHLFFI